MSFDWLYGSSPVARQCGCGVPINPNGTRRFWDSVSKRYEEVPTGECDLCATDRRRVAAGMSPLICPLPQSWNTWAGI